MELGRLLENTEEFEEYKRIRENPRQSEREFERIWNNIRKYQKSKTIVENSRDSKRIQKNSGELETTSIGEDSRK